MTEKRRIFHFLDSVYYVTPNGNVENSQHHRMRQTDNGCGYKIVGFSSGGKRKNFYVHRLVAWAFLPNQDKLPEVNHKDGNKSNNNVSNLEWVTGKENIQHALRNGLKPSGSQNWNHNLTGSQAKLVFEAYWAGVPSKTIMEALSISRHTVCDIANKSIYKVETEELKNVK